jgi:hypothetical protein
MKYSVNAIHRDHPARGGASYRRRRLTSTEGAKPKAQLTSFNFLNDLICDGCQSLADCAASPAPCRDTQYHSQHFPREKSFGASSERTESSVWHNRLTESAPQLTNNSYSGVTSGAPDRPKMSSTRIFRDLPYSSSLRKST